MDGKELWRSMEGMFRAVNGDVSGGTGCCCVALEAIGSEGLTGWTRMSSGRLNSRMCIAINKGRTGRWSEASQHPGSLSYVNQVMY